MKKIILTLLFTSISLNIFASIDQNDDRKIKKVKTSQKTHLTEEEKALAERAKEFEQEVKRLEKKRKQEEKQYRKNGRY